MKEFDFNTQLVPFGKYKGQPVSVMQNDTQYCEWLSTQDWFRERYANVYNQVIINNFTEPTETPEHNRLQLKFLDDDFCVAFSNKILDFSLEQKFNKNVSAVKKIYKEVKEYLENSKDFLSKENLNGYTTFFAKAYMVKDFFEITNKSFEHNSFDVAIEYKYYKVHEDGCCYPWGLPEVNKKFYRAFDIREELLFVYVEIKPCLGDDFPAVLRQIKANSVINIGRGRKQELQGKKILLIDEFTAVGATLEQVKKVFELSDINLLTFQEIEG